MSGRGTVVAVVGPTATGKSALSLDLARELGGEVVNADSMQLYRGMDVGTAKLTPEQRAGVPHHVLDIWDVTEPASVAGYQRHARAAIDEILARGRVPLLVGGSGLYVRAVLEDFAFPGTDPAVRARLEDELAATGPAALHARLAGLDPAAAAAILPSNGRRIVRALEVIELTGGPFTASLPEPVPFYPSVQIGVDVETTVLDARIERRVHDMMAAGLEDEVRGLLGKGLAEGPTASRALGYQQILRYLSGRGTREDAVAETITATRRFVRRQRSWFRRDPRIHWLDGAAPQLPRLALALLTEPPATVPRPGPPAPASRPELPAPALRPELPAPASRLGLSAAALRPELPAPASRSELSAAASRPELPAPASRPGLSAAAPRRQLPAGVPPPGPCGDVQ